MGRPAPPGAPPRRGGHGRAGRQVRRPARRLPVGRRGAARRRLRPRGPGQARWVASDECQTPRVPPGTLADVDAVCVPGGFGIRGIEGKLGALTYARTHGIPTLGPVPGPAVHGDRVRPRRWPGSRRPASTEFDPDCPEPVIATMAEQHAVVEGAGDLGGTMRLGLYPADAQGGLGRPRGVRRGPGRGAAPAPLRGEQRLPRAARGGRAGLLRHLARTTAWSSSSSCPRDVHPYYVATQAHPELRSRPTRPHPLFAGPGRVRRSSGSGSCASRSTRPGCAGLGRR